MTHRPVSTLAVAPAVLAGVLLAHAGLKAVIFWGPYQARVALPVELATGGLVTAITLSGLLSWAVLVGGGMLAAGRLRPRDLGLSLGHLRDAGPVLLGLWLTVQVAHAALGSATGELTLAASASSRTLAEAAGLRLQAVVGSGLLEEVLYRGFLLTQVFVLLRSRVGRDRALVWAVVASSLYFGLNHIPAYSRAGLAPAEVAVFVGQCVLVGALFGALFLRTGNVLVVAGAHALINDPVALFATSIDPALVALVAVAGLMLAWPALTRLGGRPFTVGVVEGSPAL